MLSISYFYCGTTILFLGYSSTTVVSRRFHIQGNSIDFLRTPNNLAYSKFLLLLVTLVVDYISHLIHCTLYDCRISIKLKILLYLYRCIRIGSLKHLRWPKNRDGTSSANFTTVPTIRKLYILQLLDTTINRLSAEIIIFVLTREVLKLD